MRTPYAAIVPDRRWIASVAAGVVLVASFLPWLRSGSRDRSSYELFEIVDRLGFSPDGPVGWAVRLWPWLPFALVLTILIHWLPDKITAVARVRFAVTLVASVYAGGTAVAILMAPEVGLFSVRLGPWVTIPAAVVLLGGAVSRGWDGGEAS